MNVRVEHPEHSSFLLRGFALVGHKEMYENLWPGCEALSETDRLSFLPDYSVYGVLHRVTSAFGVVLEDGLVFHWN